MPASDNRPAEEQIESEAKRAEVVRLKRQGLSFREIGERLGFSRQWAHDLYWDAIRETKVRQVTEHRAEELNRLYHLMHEVEDILHRDHLAVSHGKVVRLDSGVEGEPGELVHDDMPKIAAAREIRQLSESLRKLLGVDVPVKQQIETDSTVKYVVEGVDPTAMT